MKTAHSTITHVLRGIGLKPTEDFTVHQVKQKNKVTGVRVFLQNPDAERAVYESNLIISEKTALTSFPFHVTIHITKRGHYLCDIWHEVPR